MSRNRKPILSTLLIIWMLPLMGQSNYNLPPKKTYEKATIGLVNFQKLEVNNLVILNDSIEYISKQVNSRLHFDEINYIRVVEGTKAKNGALIGGASMLIISLASILQVQSDPDYELRDNVGGTAGLFILGGTAIGALIGAAIQKKTSYYIHATKNKSL